MGTPAFFIQNNIYTLNLLFQDVFVFSKNTFPVQFLCYFLAYTFFVQPTLDHCSLHPFNETPTPYANTFLNEVHHIGSGTNGNFSWNLFLIPPIAAKILLNLDMLLS